MSPTTPTPAPRPLMAKTRDDDRTAATARELLAALSGPEWAECERLLDQSVVNGAPGVLNTFRAVLSAGKTARDKAQSLIGA